MSHDEVILLDIIRAIHLAIKKHIGRVIAVSTSALKIFEYNTHYQELFPDNYIPDLEARIKRMRTEHGLE